MRASWSTVALVAFLAGCGSCERPEQHPATGGGAAAPAAAPPSATNPATMVATPASGGATPATPAGAPTAAAATPGAPGAAAEGEGGTEDGDCIVIGDASPDYGAPPLEVEFSAEAECSAGQPKYRWDFGDGSNSTDPNATHTYARAGEYTAVITVTAADGSTSTDEIDITVEEEAAELE